MRFAQLDRTTLVVVTVWLLICGCGKQEPPAPPKSPAESFKEYAAEVTAELQKDLEGRAFVHSSETTREEKIQRQLRNAHRMTEEALSGVRAGGYEIAEVRLKYSFEVELSDKYTIDVKRDDSLLTPFRGVIRTKAYRRNTVLLDFFPNNESLLNVFWNDFKAKEAQPIENEIQCAYRDGKWTREEDYTQQLEQQLSAKVATPEDLKSQPVKKAVNVVAAQAAEAKNADAGQPDEGILADAPPKKPGIKLLQPIKLPPNGRLSLVRCDTVVLGEHFFEFQRGGPQNLSGFGLAQKLRSDTGFFKLRLNGASVESVAARELAIYGTSHWPSLVSAQKESDKQKVSNHQGGVENYLALRGSHARLCFEEPLWHFKFIIGRKGRVAQDDIIFEIHRRPAEYGAKTTLRFKLDDEWLDLGQMKFVPRDRLPIVLTETALQSSHLAPALSVSIPIPDAVRIAKSKNASLELGGKEIAVDSLLRTISEADFLMDRLLVLGRSEVDPNLGNNGNTTISILGLRFPYRADDATSVDALVSTGLECLLPINGKLRENGKSLTRHAEAMKRWFDVQQQAQQAQDAKRGVEAAKLFKEAERARAEVATIDSQLLQGLEKVRKRSRELELEAYHLFDEKMASLSSEVVGSVGFQSVLTELLGDLSTDQGTTSGRVFEPDQDAVQELPEIQQAIAETERTLSEKAAKRLEDFRTKSADDVKSTQEKKASTILTSAKGYIEKMKHKLAKQMLTSIVKQYPETDARQEAEELLKKLPDE